MGADHTGTRARAAVSATAMLVTLLFLGATSAQLDDAAGKALAQLTVDEHNRCKRMKVRAACFSADRLYAEYFAHFPSDKRRHDLAFFWAELLYEELADFARAAEQYARVGPGKFGETAAYDRILAFEKLKDDAAVIAACDRYVALYPRGRDAADIELAAAQRSHDDERLVAVVRHRPGEDAGRKAADLLIEAATQKSDWDQVSAWADELLAIDGLGDYARSKLVRARANAEVKKRGLRGNPAARVLRDAARQVVAPYDQAILSDADAFDPSADSALALVATDPTPERLTEAIERLERAGRIAEARRLRAWRDFLPRLEAVEEPPPDEEPAEEGREE